MALLMAHQLRAARSMLRWEQEQVATAAGVAIGTIRRIEAMDGPIRAQLHTVRKIQEALEAAGVEFLDGGQPGVRMRTPSAAA
jgi:transcriptional regulator with XRE-family HTH domain